MHLSKEVLRKLVEEQKLVEGYEDIDKQLTANGFDVRIAAVLEILDGGKLAINKTDNRLPKLGRAVVLKGYEGLLEGYDIKEINVVESDIVKFEKLRPYLIVTCEKVNTPNNLMFHIAPRSSLFRLTQSSLGLAFGEAGYQGCLTFMITPFLNCEIELGARIAQLVFSELKGESNYEHQNESNYQGGKLF